MPKVSIKIKEIKLAGNITPASQDKFIEKIKKALKQKGEITAICIILSSV